MSAKDIGIELLSASHLEHFKFEKEMSMYLPVNHPKRIKIRNQLNKLSEELKKLK